jgi:hypothetical protein
MLTSEPRITMFPKSTTEGVQEYHETVSLELLFHCRKEDCLCSGREVITVVPCRVIELCQSLHVVYECIAHISNADL